MQGEGHGFEPRRLHVKILHMTVDHPRYQLFVAEVTAEPLAGQWQRDAESAHEDGTAYFVALAEDLGGRLWPAAWAGYRIEGTGDNAVLRCCNNYVHRGFRNHDPELYAEAYHARHEQIVTTCGLPAVTYLFPEPIALHETDGWVRDTTPGSAGISVVTGVEHHWQRLTRAAG